MKNLISRISFEEAKEKYSFQSAYECMHGERTTFLGFNMKNIIVLILCLIVPIIYLVSISQYDTKEIQDGKNHLFITINIIFLIVLVFSIAIYFILYRKYSNIFLRKFRHGKILFILPEINVTLYSSLIILNIFSNTSSYISEGILIVYLFLTYIFVRTIVSTKLIAELNNSYDFNEVIPKWKYYLVKFPMLCLTLSVIGSQLYRLTKSFFIASKSGNLLFQLYDSIGNFGLLFLAFSIALLPTILFNPKIIIQGELYQKHPEEFRKEYDFTKEEWYGEE
ncbi:MAG: hypothetical protein LBS33_02365 [Streptococcaceae bacterium]|jgi:fumarate reductase subunit C|nr:hypothetical protein [Streptococcaceae bacterium]